MPATAVIVFSSGVAPRVPPVVFHGLVLVLRAATPLAALYKAAPVVAVFEIGAKNVDTC